MTQDVANEHYIKNVDDFDPTAADTASNSVEHDPSLRDVPTGKFPSSSPIHPSTGHVEVVEQKSSPASRPVSPWRRPLSPSSGDCLSVDVRSNNDVPINLDLPSAQHTVLGNVGFGSTLVQEVHEGLDAQAPSSASSQISDLIITKTQGSASLEDETLSQADLGFLDAPQTAGSPPPQLETATVPTAQITVKQQGEINEDVQRFTKQLRSLRAVTDRLLVLRASWRHEQQSLESREKFLHESTSDLMSALQIQFSTTTSITLGSAQSRAQMREVPEHPPSSEPRSRSASGSGSKSGVDSGIIRSQNLTKLFIRYSTDYANVAEQEPLVNDIADKISHLEYTLKETLDAIKISLSQKHLFDELKWEMLASKSTPSNPGSRHSSVRSLPPLVASFFDRMGDIGIFNERLADLDFTHDEGKMEREFMRDRGDSVEPSDQQFEVNYKTRRKQIEHDLATAQDDAEMLRKRCEDAQLDINAYRKTTSRPSEFLTSTHPSMLDLPDPAHLDRRFLARPMSKPATSTQQIDLWLEGLSDQSSVVDPAGNDESLHVFSKQLDESHEKE